MMPNDMYAQAQAAQAPQAPMPGNSPEDILTPEGFDDPTNMTAQIQGVKNFQASQGMPLGDKPEAVAQRVMMLFEDAGLLNKGTPEQKAELEKLVMEFAEAIVNQDGEALKKSPIPALIEKFQNELVPKGQGPTQEPMAMAQQAKGMM